MNKALRLSGLIVLAAAIVVGLCLMFSSPAKADGPVPTCYPVCGK